MLQVENFQGYTSRKTANGDNVDRNCFMLFLLLYFQASVF